jgi:hypothetical protein
MKRLLTLLAIASLFFAVGTLTASAQTGIQVSDASFIVDYPKQIKFHLAAKSAADINQVGLAVRFPTTGTTTRIAPKFSPGVQLDVTGVWSLDRNVVGAAGGYLPPGARGEFSWHIQDAAGNQFDTPFQPFRVDDNRRSWKQLTNDKMALYWYDGDDSFGKAIFDKANKALVGIQSSIGATIDYQIQIFIYGNRDEFLSALQPGQHEFAGGTIIDEFGIVLVQASPTGPGDDLQYALVATPHELIHLVVAQELKGPFKDVSMPLWMNEGLASYYEYDPPQMEPRYKSALQQAIKSDSLIRLRTLEGKFPDDYSLAILAYGEGYSVDDFIMRQYGTDKLRRIFALYKAGTTNDDAFQQVLGVDEDGLENLWRKSVGAQQKSYTRSPTITPGAVPTFSLSSAETPGGSTTTPPAVALQPTPAPSPNTAPTPQSSGGKTGGGGGLCGGLFGGMVLAGFGVWWMKRYRNVGT